MGFKCRTLVLQGQLDASERECEHLRALVQQQQQDKELSARVKQDKIRLESEKQNLEGVVSLLQEDIIKLHKKLNTAIDTIQKRDEEITRLHTLEAERLELKKTKETLQRQSEEIARSSLPHAPVPAKRTVFPRPGEQESQHQHQIPWPCPHQPGGSTIADEPHLHTDALHKVYS
eukprot:Em0016g1050a